MHGGLARNWPALSLVYRTVPLPPWKIMREWKEKPDPVGNNAIILDQEISFSRAWLVDQLFRREDNTPVFSSGSAFDSGEVPGCRLMLPGLWIPRAEMQLIRGVCL